jgi:hypothetical protein
MLERHRLGELEPGAARRLETLMASDETLRDRLAALAQADVEASLAYPPEMLVRDVRRRVAAASSHRSSVRPRMALAGTVATAAMLAFVVARFGDGWQSASPAQQTVTGDDGRPKGSDATLVVYRNTDQGPALLADGDVARAGDVVRIGYRVVGRTFGVIASVDGWGVLTRHLPDAGMRAVELVPGETVMLDRAFELDDAPEVERVLLISAPEPFDLAPVFDSVRRAGDGGAVDLSALRLPPSFTTTAFSLRKDSHP